jgi:ABC-type protease/lipase transport system fused ATPase/permease subunit
LYGDPQVIVLDEPNSNLDQEGEAALERTLVDLKRAGRTVVVITHRKNILGVADKVLMMSDGQLAIYGPRDKVLTALQQAADKAAGRAPASLNVVPSAVAPGSAALGQAGAHP